MDFESEMRAMVLCAGLGTRLGELTRQTPKALLPLHGGPILEYILANLRRHGFDEIAINLHMMPETIHGHFGDGAKFGVKLTYSHESVLLGTSGRRRVALARIGSAVARQTLHIGVSAEGRWISGRAASEPATLLYTSRLRRRVAQLVRAPP